MICAKGVQNSCWSSWVSLQTGHLLRSCHSDNATRLEGRFKGYAQVASRDKDAVKEALMRHGPLAVGVDAEHDFAFYS